MGDTGDQPVPVWDGTNINPAWHDFIANSNGTISQPAVSGGNITCSSDRFFHSKFTSDSNTVKSSFEISQAISAGVNSVLLALDPAGSSGIQVAVGDILSAFDVDLSSLPSLIATIVDVLKSPIDTVLPKFQLDTSDNSKNGTWIIGVNSKTLEIDTTLTLVMLPLGSGKVIDLGQPVQSSLKSDASLQIPADSLKFSSSNLPQLRMKHRAVITKAADGTFSLSTSSEIIIEIPISDFLISLRVGIGGRLEVGLLNRTGAGALTGILDLLSGGPAEHDAKPSAGDILNDIEFWKVIVKTPGPSGFNDIRSGFEFEIGFFVNLKLTNTASVVIGLTYDTETGEFGGSLLFQEQFTIRLDPDNDDLEDLPPGKLRGMTKSYDLATMSVFSSLKNLIPTKLLGASITYNNGSDDSPYELRFSAAMGSDAPPTKPDQTIPMPFDWTGISLNYYHRGATDTEEPVNALSITSTFELFPPKGQFQTNDMIVSFDYNDGGSGPSTWDLSASVRRIQLGSIAQFFDKNLSPSVLDVLGKISIDEIDVSYTYTEHAASSFLFIGIISFGDLQLKLYYQYVSKETASSKNSAAHEAKSSEDNGDLVPIDDTGNEDYAWRFDAYLDVVAGAVTIGQIADSIADSASNSLPGFIRDIPVAPSGSDHLLSLHCGKASITANGTTTDHATFLLDVSISDLEFTFEQLSSTSSSGDATTKRLIRVSAGKFPLLSSLPVVKELPQPWQKLQYMWIPPKGISRDEVTALNQQLVLDGSNNKLCFKPATKDDTDPSSGNDPMVLEEGHHFIVVHNDEAVLDHVFGSDSTQPPEGSGGSTATTSSLVVRAAAADDTNNQEKPPTKGSVVLHLGILDITAISLQYKQGHVWIFIDATLALGPLSLSLIGFGVGLNISGIKLNDLSSLTSILNGIDFALHGMEVSFDNPPILISGCFYHDITQNGNQTVDAYRGGIAVAIPPYTFVAVGEYAIVTITNGDQFKSVFIFAKLDGPIIDFEFAILRGLRIGFGYNSSVRSPAVEELTQFPLIDNGTVSGAGNHPMAILEKMEGGSNPFVQLKQDNYWLAFGFTISSFDLISATVVALVQFGNAGCIFSLFGDLTIAYPPDSPPDVKLFNIEILMMAELNFVDDVFKLEAALAPTSFVLVPYCKLFGGLALYTFFGHSPHAGDWVLSVGGYHRLFDIPPWYPLPSRIGLDFNIAIIHIRGEGYFAITPKAIMTGCMIRCELSLGPVYAWLDAGFDAMVQFSPLHYWVSMHVEVGIKCDVRILFCTIHIKISIGAGLDIQGPEFGGTAYVDFWFFSFSFDFGAAAKGPPPISLQDFYALCEKSGPPDTSPNGSATDGLTVKIKMSLEDGSYSMPSDGKVTSAPPDDSGAGAKWFVKGGSFQFRISSVFAITEGYIETEDSSLRHPDGTTVLLGAQDTSKMQPVPSILSPSKLSSLPMDLSADLSSPTGDGITSKMCVAVQDVDDKNLAIEGFKPSFVVKAMPQTLWADPKRPPDRLTQDKGTVDLPMAVTFSAPDPVLAESKIPQFNATDMAKECAGGNLLPQLPTVSQQDLLPEPLPTPAPKPADQWAAMEKTWSDSSNNNLPLANSLTDLCMITLGWDKPPPDVVAKANAAGIEPWKVPVAFPSRLVTGTGREAEGIEDGLDSFYLELPRTTIAPVH